MHEQTSVNGMSDSFRDERLLGEPDSGEPVARRRSLAFSTICPEESLVKMPKDGEHLEGQEKPALGRMVPSRVRPSWLQKSP